MKKLVALVLTAAMLLCCVTALADSTFDRFQPYTKVDLSVFEQAGYSSSVDEFCFTAEFYPPVDEITYGEGGNYGDTYTIRLDVKAIYSAGEVLLVPRMIFSRKGWDTYFDDRMADVYIRNGENRYHVDLTNVSRSTDSKNYSASDSCVEPIRARGTIMLMDLATAPKTVEVKMGSYCTTGILSADNLAVIKSFYETCEKAGIFEQESLYTYDDDYYVITLFNEGSSGTENATEEAEPEPTEAKE